MQDWSVTEKYQSTSSGGTAGLGIHLRIEQFRYRLSQTLSSNEASTRNSSRSQERLTVYELLNSALVDLERDVPETDGNERIGSDIRKIIINTRLTRATAISQFYLSAARLSLACFLSL